jgi:predicted Zn finger-like uncharacterized protein
MSLITRCPACGTMFKVVPDQLRISEGWVRCGHCSDVFDARAHLQDEGTPEPVGYAAGAGLTVEAAAPLAAKARFNPADDAPADSFQESGAFASSLVTEIDDALPSQGPDSEQLAEEAQALKEHPLDRPFELRREDISDSQSDADDAPGQKATALVPKRVQARPAPKPAAAPRPDSDENGEDSELEDLGFVRDARRKAFWDRRSVHGMLLLAGIFLAMLLGLQIAVHDRDRLAAAHPSLRPWLSAVCGPLDCVIGPPRQIDAISIDSSSFNKVRPDSYRLSVTLKNQSPTEVAMPALELTLTDAQDQPVVRRVLMPSELGANPGVVAPASEWSTSLALALAPNGNGARISGYRLLAFYP